MERSTSYIGTVTDRNDPVVDKVRRIVKIGNAANATKYYVKLQARLGKDSPYAWIYKLRRLRGADWSIDLKHGSRFDVYVYERR